MEPGPPALGAQSLSPWTNWEVLEITFLLVAIAEVSEDQFKVVTFLCRNPTKRCLVVHGA